MRKVVLLIVLSMTLLQGCASYQPIVDTSGRSGTYNEDRAREITNDLQHCKMLAKENVTALSNISYWIFSPSMDTKYEAYYRKCLMGRGHGVIN
jgi:hypothetical protein